MEEEIVRGKTFLSHGPYGASFRCRTCPFFNN
jgi:hypothetical protein